MSPKPRIAVLGTVGIPARYGGFETLAEALVDAADRAGQADRLTVYCSAPQSPPPRAASYKSATLRYIPLRANGVQSVPYDALSLIHAVMTGHKTLFLMGVSGAITLPLIRLVSRARIIVHIDGIEWRRAKWRGVASRFLRWSERIAVRWGHTVVADNPAIAEHVRAAYGVESVQIAYGGDQARDIPAADISDLALQEHYTLALGRIEPENNIAMILEAFAPYPDRPLVVVGNWDVSPAAQALRDRYRQHPHLRLLTPVFDQARLRALREGASVYVHGHSAGGTNPALVEVMHIGRPIAAFDCAFNRETTEHRGAYFRNAAELAEIVTALQTPGGAAQGAAMAEIAARRYRWADITERYFHLLGLDPQTSPRKATGL